MERFDVAIVGAGPAGSSTAGFLARRGYSVALIDKRLFPSEKLCGDFLNPANWPLFERLGITQELLSLEHERVEAFRISSFTGEEAVVPFPSHPGNFFFGLGLRRFYLDDLLLRHAEKKGAIVKQGYRVTGLKRQGEGWSITLGNQSSEEQFHSAFLIGADGRNSWVAHQLGLAAPGERSGTFVAFQGHLRSCRGINGEVQIHLFPGGYAGLVGLGGGMANLCLTVEKEKAKESPTLDDLLRRYLCKNLHLRQALQESERVGDVRSVYPVYFPPRRCYGEGFLLAGDAARVTEPVTGEGVYFALKSGELAAEAASLAFEEGNFSARQLARYDFACRRALSRRQRINGLIRAFIYRPRLLTPLIKLSSRSAFPVSALVNLVCQPSHEQAFSP
jgi:geranylgeranyl reductase family protein